MAEPVMYGNREAPKTSITFANMLKELFDAKTVVSVDQMKKKTGKKWIRGFMNTLSIVHGRKVIPVKNGRSVIGFRYEDKPLEMTKDGTAFRGPLGTFITLASAAKVKEKKAAAKVKVGAAPKTTTPKAVTKKASKKKSAETAPAVVSETTPQEPSEPVQNVIPAVLTETAPVVEQVKSEPAGTHAVLEDIGGELPAFLRKS